MIVTKFLSLASLLVIHPCISLADDSSYGQNAGATLDRLQLWYNSGAGLWNTAGWWNGANCLTVLASYSLLDGGVASRSASVFASTYANAPNYNPSQVKVRGATSSDMIQTFYVPPAAAKRDLPVVASFLGAIEGPPTDWSSWVKPTKVARSLPRARSMREDPAEIEKRASNSGFLNDYYDDEGWWGLAWVAVYDVTHDQKYLIEAANIFNDMAAAWNTPCGGGIWWDRSHTYVNAIANELFISLGAHLANRIDPSLKQGYLDWATRGWTWFSKSGLINSAGTVNDGLTSACANNGAVWSYNQGVILGGLSSLHHATGNTAYLDSATRIADAAIAALSRDGVLHDPCEPNCGGDGTQFKGIFMRNLAQLYNENRQPRWKSFAQKNAQSIWGKDLQFNPQGGIDLSVDWDGPWVAPANASTQSSALDALIAALGMQ